MTKSFIFPSRNYKMDRILAQICLPVSHTIVLQAKHSVLFPKDTYYEAGESGFSSKWKQSRSALGSFQRGCGDSLGPGPSHVYLCSLPPVAVTITISFSIVSIIPLPLSPTLSRSQVLSIVLFTRHHLIVLYLIVCGQMDVIKHVFSIPP